MPDDPNAALIEAAPYTGSMSALQWREHCASLAVNIGITPRNDKGPLRKASEQEIRIAGWWAHLRGNAYREEAAIRARAELAKENPNA